MPIYIYINLSLHHSGPRLRSVVEGRRRRRRVVRAVRVCVCVCVCVRVCTRLEQLLDPLLQARRRLELQYRQTGRSSSFDSDIDSDTDLDTDSDTGDSDCRGPGAARIRCGCAARARRGPTRRENSLFGYRGLGGRETILFGAWEAVKLIPAWEAIKLIPMARRAPRWRGRRRFH